jgi:hypothetical protein
VSWTAATLVPIASTAKTTRPPRTSVKYTRSVATSRLGVYRKSSCWKGAVCSAMGITDGPRDDWRPADRWCGCARRSRQQHAPQHPTTGRLTRTIGIWLTKFDSCLVELRGFEPLTPCMPLTSQPLAVQHTPPRYLIFALLGRRMATKRHGAACGDVRLRCWQIARASCSNGQHHRSLSRPNQHLRCSALLRRFRIERRANDDASSVMPRAQGWIGTQLEQIL